jgi:hypothetical protein
VRIQLWEAGEGCPIGAPPDHCKRGVPQALACVREAAAQLARRQSAAAQIAVRASSDAAPLAGTLDRRAPSRGV